MIIKVKNFNDAIKNVSNAISKDKNRPMFCGIHFRTDDTRRELILEATNGYVLNTSRIPVEEDFFDIDMIIKDVTKVATDKPIVEITKVEKGLQIGNTIYEIIEGQFLDTKEILKGNRTFRVGVNPKYLEMAIKDLKFKTIRKDEYPIVLEFDISNYNEDRGSTSPFTIRSEMGSLEVKSENMVLPVRLN